MNCPRCSQEAVPEASQCPGCGFTLHSLDEHFGVEPVVLERLIDSAHCLKLREKEQVEDSLLEFEAMFPQLFASVYIGSLPDWTSVTEFGVWLLNRSSITKSEIPRSNSYAFILVIDPDLRTAGITAGYAAEQILSEKYQAKSLVKARTAWRAGEYANGISIYLKRLTKLLKKACRKMPAARKTSADRLDTLPPPDLSPHPAQAPGGGRSDLLEEGESNPDRSRQPSIVSQVPDAQYVQHQPAVLS